ncbi:MAG: hypothetical protein NTY32_06400 [Bacteroidia bacterium]|nr:hypothetical protein [Bacteroidia bacterium]
MKILLTGVTGYIAQRLLPVFIGKWSKNRFNNKRIFLRVPFLLALVLIFIQINSVMAASNTETQTYRILKTEKNYEIRFYPPAILATVISSANRTKN